jgi:hypothetical protein
MDSIFAGFDSCSPSPGNATFFPEMSQARRELWKKNAPLRHSRGNGRFLLGPDQQMLQEGRPHATQMVFIVKVEDHGRWPMGR